MIKIIIITYLFLFFTTFVKADIKTEIILNLKKTQNLSFKFVQSINDKSENGNCVIHYPKKIFCAYNNVNKKIMVSNGRSLVIKNNNINQYYIYPLKKTALEFILDKDYLIKKIIDSEGRLIDNKYFNFTIFENKNQINIFFDAKNLNLVGWQMEDVYQNLIITFISSIKINQKIDDSVFILPQKN